MYDEGFSKYEKEDNDEKKSSELKINELEEKYRHLFNSVPYGIWLVNYNGIIVDCNETMNKFLAIFKKGDLVGKHFADVIKMFSTKGDSKFSNLQTIFQSRFQQIVKGNLLSPLEFQISRGDGKPLWISLESSLVKLRNETLIQVFIRDITKQKKTELTLKSLKKELEKRIRKRTIKLEKSEEMYRQAYDRASCFKGLFTHDINNMFHSIRMAVQLCESLLDKNIFNKDEFLEYFDLINAQICRGEKLVNDIHNLSQIEKSGMEVRPIEVITFLNSAISFVSKNFHEKELEIKINTTIKEVHVLANELLVDVFENILINAIRHNINDKIEIEIKTLLEKKQNQNIVRFEFRDNGVGIPENQKKEIFIESKKIKNDQSEGMGLGLSFIVKLIDLYNGEIWVEDKVEGDHSLGSNFVVLLPEAK
ncbi:MAG: PAS domain S-box protein [Candidatus Lokiarchaeota archaeon]|nr:PAS domain S-box protein [Candidatus Lokiarchaeota archaeon]